MLIYYWSDPKAGERQSIGVEFWRIESTGEIIGLCSEFDIVWIPFAAAIAGEPGQPRPRAWNLFPNATIRPATRDEIDAADLLPYVTDAYEDAI